MTRAEFESYLLVLALAFAAIGVVNLLRPTKRWLGVGALLFGVGAMLYRGGLALPYAATPCLLGVACIAAQAREAERRKP